MSSKPKLSHRFIATMMIVSCISVTLFVCFVVVIEDQLEVLSLNHWLNAEADRYFKHIDSDSPYIPNPDEFDYYTSDKKFPIWLTNYPKEGFYEHELGPDDRHFLVREIKGREHFFYLVFRKDADDYLDTYESNLIVFTVVLAVSFFLMMLIFSVYLVRLISKPFNQLNSKIANLAPNNPGFVRDAHYQEFQVIEDALHESKRRIADFFKREQEFSRFAAHEIRTPLMVLKGSSELLNHIDQGQSMVSKAAKRIATASDEIGLLTNTFLLLGKEQIERSFYRQVAMSAVVDKCLADANKLFLPRQLKILCDVKTDIYVDAPPEFVSVLVSNLIKNSFSYVSEENSADKDRGDDISIMLTDRTLCISNCYDVDEKKSGYGYGLVIVKRICQRLEWELEVIKDENRFVVNIIF